MKLLSKTKQGKWNEPPTVRKVRTAAGVYVRPRTLANFTIVRLSHGARWLPFACVWTFEHMHRCNGGTLFTWNTASMTHCHFHSSFYFSSNSWRGRGSEFMSMPLFSKPSDSSSIFIFPFFSSAFNQSLLTSLPFFHQLHFLFFHPSLPSNILPVSWLSHCCSVCQDMNNWGVLSLVSRWWDGRYGTIRSL